MRHKHLISLISDSTVIKVFGIKKKDENLKVLPLFATEDLNKVNFFQSLITSLNYLIWGDV